IEPDTAWSLMSKGIYLAALKKVDDIPPLLKKLDQAVKNSVVPPLAYHWPAFAYQTEIGNERAADAELTEIMKIVNDPQGSIFVIANSVELVVPVLARHNKKTEAFRILMQSEKRAMLPAYDWLLLNPELASLRGEPEFERILA